MQNERKTALRETAEAIRRASSLLLACHIRPDADALGSLLGLALGLKAMGKRVQPLSPDGVPAMYRFLPHWEEVVQAAAPGYDTGIGMDADGSHRLGPAEAAILAAPMVIDVDHHTSAHRYGNIQLVDASACATGELVFELLEELGVPLNPEIAQCLMAAILTDTGSFRFSNVSANTFRIASALVAAGAHPEPIYEAVYGTRPFDSGKLLGRLLARMEHSDCGRIIWAGLSVADFQETGVHPSQTEGFVEQLRMAEGSEVAIFLREDSPGEIRVSLRSRGGVNVAQVAAEFGGGGHVPAAGCTLSGDVDDAARRVVAAVRRRLP